MFYVFRWQSNQFIGDDKVPTYEYRCQVCSHTFEKFQNITDKPISRCPKCGHNSAPFHKSMIELYHNLTSYTLVSNPGSIINDRFLSLRSILNMPTMLLWIDACNNWLLWKLLQWYRSLLKSDEKKQFLSFADCLLRLTADFKRNLKNRHLWARLLFKLPKITTGYIISVIVVKGAIFQTKRWPALNQVSDYARYV